MKYLSVGWNSQFLDVGTRFRILFYVNECNGKSLQIQLIFDKSYQKGNVRQREQAVRKLDIVP